MGFFPPNTPNFPPFPLAPWSASHLIYSETFFHERHKQMNKQNSLPIIQALSPVGVMI